MFANSSSGFLSFPFLWIDFVIVDGWEHPQERARHRAFVLVDLQLKGKKQRKTHGFRISDIQEAGRHLAGRR